MPLRELGPKQHHVYCDESQTSGARFTVYGGIILPAKNVGRVMEAVESIRFNRGMFHEVKWEKVSRRDFDGYKALVDMTFDLLSSRHMSFKSVVFDSHDRMYLRDRRHTDEGFYKLYYYFLLHKFGPYAQTREHSLYVYLDERKTNYKLSTLHTILNNGIAMKWARLGPRVVKTVEPRTSHRSALIQLADVLMGAVGYQCNGLDRRTDASPHKVALAKHIAAKAGLKTLTVQTPWAKRDFEIWMFRPKAALEQEKKRPSP
jgi:hypothetical protein